MEGSRKDAAFEKYITFTAWSFSAYFNRSIIIMGLAWGKVAGIKGWKKQNSIQGWSDHGYSGTLQSKGVL